MNWPHFTVISIRMARIADHEGEGLEGEVNRLFVNESAPVVGGYPRRGVVSLS